MEEISVCSNANAPILRSPSFRMISVAGAVIGIAVGLLLCWLQQRYGIVRLGDEAGNFVINAYPISVHPVDIVTIFVTVIAVGWLAVWYPVRRFTTKIE